MWVNHPVSPFRWSTHIQNTGTFPLSLDLMPCVLSEKNVSDYNAEILARRRI